MYNTSYNNPCSSCGRTFIPFVYHSPDFGANYYQMDARPVHQRVCALLAAENNLFSPAWAPPPPSHLSLTLLDLASDHPNPASTTSAANPALSVQLSEPFHRLSVRNWLHNRSEHDVYRLLIDVYRQRMADQFETSLGGINVDRDSVWCIGTRSSIGGFTRFLFRIYNTAPDLLPPWWCFDAHVRCREYGMPTILRPQEGQAAPAVPWQDLRRMVGRWDIERFYRDMTMPTQMAIFAAAVYGRGAGGVNTLDLLRMWVNVELEERGRPEGPYFDRTEGVE